MVQRKGNEPPTNKQDVPAPAVRRPPPGVVFRSPTTLQIRSTPPLVGPTPDLTAVANSIRMNAKSLTLLVAFAPGLSLTKSVEISIAFTSPAGGERITQSYVAGTGNRFLHYDLEGDGKPRFVHVDITLSEHKHGGDVSFNLPGDAYLDPLYDVTITPLQFSLLDDCALIGDSDITLLFASPGASPTIQGIAYAYFKTSAGQVTTINEFAWAGTELSASRGLQMPDAAFYSVSNDWWVPGVFHPGWARSSTANLVPGKTRTIGFNPTNIKDSGDCQAYAEYTIMYQLTSYPYLA
jgi:hypothetical protein